MIIHNVVLPFFNLLGPLVLRRHIILLQILAVSNDIYHIVSLLFESVSVGTGHVVWQTHQVFTLNWQLMQQVLMPTVLLLDKLPVFFVHVAFLTHGVL